MTTNLLTDLARVKAIFQQRAILAAIGVDPDTDVAVKQCPNCGDHDCAGGLPCESGDSV